MTKLVPLALLLAACGGGAAADLPDASPAPFSVDQPTALVTGLDFPNGIAADERAVYWVEHATAIRSYDLATGDIAELATTGSTAQLAIDDGYVYWVDHDAMRVERVAKGGGAIEPIFSETSAVADVAVADGRVYWVSDQKVRSARGDGTDFRELGPSSFEAADVFADADRVLWISSDGLWAVDIGGGTPAHLADVGSGAVVTGGGHVYLADRLADHLLELAPDGGSPAPVQEGPEPGRLVHADDGTLYWATVSDAPPTGTGGLWKRAPGGQPEEIKAVTHGAVGVALSSGASFFTEFDSQDATAGAIWAAPR